MINEEFLKVLACPLCKSEVFMQNGYIECTNCKRKYPIKGGIPIMLPEEAELDEENKTK